MRGVLWSRSSRVWSCKPALWTLWSKSMIAFADVTSFCYCLSCTHLLCDYLSLSLSLSLSFFLFQVSFFEIYGGKLFDLLNGRQKLVAREDANQKCQVVGLTVQLCLQTTHTHTHTHTHAHTHTRARALIVLIPAIGAIFPGKTVRWYQPIVARYRFWQQCPIHGCNWYV